MVYRRIPLYIVLCVSFHVHHMVFFIYMYVCVYLRWTCMRPADELKVGVAHVGKE